MQILRRGRGRTRRAAAPRDPTTHVPVVGIVVATGLSLLVQTVALYAAGFTAFSPDLPLGAVLAVSFRFGPGPAIAAGASCGLLQDALSTGILGMNGFSKPLVGYTLARLREHLLGHSPGRATLVLSLAAIADLAVLRILRELSGVPFPDAGGALRIGFGLAATVGWSMLLLLLFGGRDDPRVWGFRGAGRSAARRR